MPGSLDVYMEEPTILYYRAKRLRELTGDSSFKSQEEIKQADLTATQRLWDSIIKPWEVNIKDPALLFMTLYMGLIYAIVYSFFEVSYISSGCYQPGLKSYSLCPLSTHPCTASHSPRRR